MSGHGTHHGSDIEPVLPDPSYMDRDINLRALIIFFVLCMVITVLSFISMWFTLQYMDSNAKAAAERGGLSTFATERAIPDPSKGPVLQAWPVQEIENYEKYQDAALNSSKKSEDGSFVLGMPEAMQLAISNKWIKAQSK